MQTIHKTTQVYIFSTEEAKKKMSEANKGRPRDEQYRQKISEGLKRYFALKKQRIVIAEDSEQTPQP